MLTSRGAPPTLHAQRVGYRARMTELERIDLHLAEDDNDAAALLHELEQKGIEGVVARGAKGPIVRVSADDQERAKAVLRAWLGEDREPPARASKLGWVMALALVGSLALNAWLAIHLSPPEEYLEDDLRDAEGRLRAWFEYSGNSEFSHRMTMYDSGGRLVATFFDENEDGNWERSALYAGAEVRMGEQIDADEDGLFELTSWERPAGLVRYEDTDGDTASDRMEVERDGKVVTRGIDADRDHVYERLVRLSEEGEEIARLDDFDGDGFYDRARVREADGSWRIIPISTAP